MEQKLNEMVSLLSSSQTLLPGRPIVSPQAQPWPGIADEPERQHLPSSFGLVPSRRLAASGSNGGSSFSSHVRSSVHTHPIYETQSGSHYDSTVPPLAICSTIVAPRAASHHQHSSGAYQLHNNSRNLHSGCPVIDIDAEDAARIVTLFRAQMACYFPFVIVDPGTSVLELQQAKPVVFAVIVLISSYHSTAQQKVLSENMLRYITEALLFREEKTLDLLQGLLVYGAWFASLHFSSIR
jgi:hypothetical protein